MSETKRLQRSERQDPELGSRRQSKVKYIYRLLRERDVGESLEGKTVYVLWPDDGTWYKGLVEECDVAAKKATIYYDETEEREEGADLEELIRDGQIAFKEPRPSTHVCRKGEIEVGTKYFGRQPGEEELEDDLEAEAGGSEDVADAGALEDSSDSDVSFSSAELSGRKRKRGGDDESDEDVVLEEFEKREIMRDMSDDEKPLGWRASELEQQQKKAGGAARRQASGSGSSAAKRAAPAASGGTPRKAAAKPAAAAAPAAAAQRPAQRQRREATLGVKAATLAVKAVQAAVAEDASSDEEPPSARKHRQRQAAGDQDEAEAEAMALLARATGKAAPAARPGARGAASFYGASGSGSGNLERRVSTGQSEAELRGKIRAGFQQALELVSKDAAGEGGQLPEAAGVAEAVEAALYAHHGGITKDYKDRYRTLQFNLKDPHNPELRAHVLRGDIGPEAFVQMTATDLASKELAAYRKAKEEEALKMSVLDAEAAARFSTAAALDARDQLAIPASVMADKGMLAAREATPEPAGPGGRSPSPAPPGATALSPTAAAAAAAAGSGLLGEQLSGRLETVGEAGGTGGDASGSGYMVSESADAELAGGEEEYDPETAFADEGPRTTAGTAGAAASTPKAAALDWASIKAAAAAAGHGGDGAGPAVQPLKFEPLATVGATPEAQQAGSEGQREHRHHHKRERPSASPRDPEASDAGGSQQLAEPGSPHSLRHLVLPPTDPACLFGKGVWEGQFFLPGGAGAFLLSADALAGSGDVAGLLGEQELEVKGRLALHKLEHFLSELRHSRSRTVTLGVLSPAEDCSPEERAALRELIASFTEQGRTGVVGPGKHVEAYLLPPCPIAERLLAAARTAAGTQVEALLPGGGTAIGPDQLLLCIIHRKDWRVPYGLTRPIRRPRVLPLPGAAAAAAAAPLAAGEPAGAAAEPLGAPAVSLPPGLDLSQLGALAAALGVTSAPPEQQPPAAAPAVQPPVPAAAPPQADQLQQLLASLPPAAVTPGAVQPPEGGQRRSRWEGGEASETAQPAGQADEQARRRSRWAEEGTGGQEFGQQAMGGMLPPPGAGQPPAPGPMGPMHRAGMAPPQAMPPPMQQQAMPPGAPPPMQQPQPFMGPPGQQQQQQQFGPPGSMAPPGSMGPPGGMGPPGSMPMPPQQFGGMAPPPGSMPFQQQPPAGGMAPPMQPFPGGGPPAMGGMPPQHQMGMGPPGSMPMQQQQQPGGYGGGPGWQGGQGPPGQYGGQYGGGGGPQAQGYGGRGYGGGRGFDGGRGGRGRWGGGGRFEGRGRGGRGRY